MKDISAYDLLPGDIVRVPGFKSTTHGKPLASVKAGPYKSYLTLCFHDGRVISCPRDQSVTVLQGPSLFEST